jgi:hypothetical protein
VVEVQLLAQPGGAGERGVLRVLLGAHPFVEAADQPGEGRLELVADLDGGADELGQRGGGQVELGAAAEALDPLAEGVEGGRGELDRVIRTHVLNSTAR